MKLMQKGNMTAHSIYLCHYVWVAMLIDDFFRFLFVTITLISPNNFQCLTCMLTSSFRYSMFPPSDSMRRFFWTIWISNLGAYHFRASFLTFYFVIYPAFTGNLFFLFYRLKPTQKQQRCLSATMASMCGETHGSVPRLRCVILRRSFEIAWKKCPDCHLLKVLFFLNVCEFQGKKRVDFMSSFLKTRSSLFIIFLNFFQN